MKNRLTSLTLLSLALAAALPGCKESHSAAPEPADPVIQGQELSYPSNHPQLRLLKTSKAEPSRMVDLAMSAKLVWNEERTQRIYPAFAGRVAQIHADLGQAVKPGALLAQLSSPDFGQAQADLARAQADANLSRKQLQRQRELLDAGIVARRDVDQAEADAARSEAELARALGRVQLYGGSGQGVNHQLALRASIGGVVVERNLNPGQELRPEQSGPGVPPLFVISDPSKLWVQIDVREADAGALRPGTRFSLEAPGLPGHRFEGRVAALADTIDPLSRTIKVRGEIDNTERLLKAEMLATVHVQRSQAGESGQGVVLPASAVLLRGDKHWVFVQSKPAVFSAREVKLGPVNAQEVVVRQGLQAGEAVVSENALLLARQFRISEEEAKPGSPATAASASGGQRP